MTLVIVLIGINALLTLFIVFMIEKVVMIMKAGTLSELLKYKQEARRGFKKEDKDDDFIY
jgi:hypothetical protein